MRTKAILFLMVLAFAARAELLVNVEPPKVAAQKVVIQLAMRNGLTNEVKAARAICLLLDDHKRVTH